MLLTNIPPFGWFEANGAVDFAGAKAAHFVVDHATFAGHLSVLHGLFANALSVSGAFVWQSVNLPNGAVLDLRDASADEFADQEGSWPSPGRLLIDGFKYGRFGSESPHDAASRLKWLRLQPVFRPQPYEQAANVLRESGYESNTLRILEAKAKAEPENTSALA